MIIEQVLLWYLWGDQGFKKMSKATSADGGKEAIAQLRNVVFEIGKSLSGILKARNRAGIFNFIEFKLIQDSKSRQMRPQYQLHDTFRIIGSNYILKAHGKEIEIRESLNESLSSSLLIDKAQADQLISVFSRAVNDLVANGHELNLNLQFCFIKVSKRHGQCSFSKAFIQQINRQSSNNESKRYQLHLCRPENCQNVIINIDEQQRKIHQTKWKEIRQGNLYNRPSLQQIKNLFDRGRQLQLKYKQYFHS